ncbi:MAG: hypothetical protein ACYDCO_23520 [Armatimonadota bacterium]
MPKSLMERIHRMNKRTRRVLLALAILAALAGWWWLFRPQEMRLVDVRPLDMSNIKGYFNPTADYLLVTPYSLSSPDPSFALFRWDGTRRWHIVPPKPVLPATVADYSRRSNYSVSPSGRYCTAVIVVRNSQQVMMWDEGRLVGLVFLPLTTKLRKGKPKPDTVLARTTTLDSGQVFCRTRTAPGESIILIEKGIIRARGKQPAPPSMTSGVAAWQISPDGQALIVESSGAFTFYRITVKGNALRFTRAYTAKDTSKYRSPFITRDGFLVTDNGVYNERGRISGSTGRHLLYHPVYDTQTPRHSSVLLAQSMDIHSFPFHFNGIRVLDPRIGDAWGPSKRGPYQFCLSTLDGQHLLVIETPTAFRQSILNRLKNRGLIPDKLYYRKDTVHLYVYRKPGRVCARLPITEDSDGSLSIRNSQTGQSMKVWPFSLSEDGHTMRCLASDGEGPSGYSYSILTYKWR